MLHLRRRTRRRIAWALFREFNGLFLTRNGALGTNPEGAQCVNVANTYMEAAGCTPCSGNAADFAGCEDQTKEWLPMARGLRLEAGDILVLPRSGDRPYGHVCVILDASVDPVVTLDQDWPWGSPVGERRHGVLDAVGVIRS